MSKGEKRRDDDRDDDDDHGSHHSGHDDDSFHFPDFHVPHGLSPAVLSGLELVYYDFADLFLTATHKQVVHYDSNLDATAHDSHNNIFSGSGSPATPWKVVDNNSA